MRFLIILFIFLNSCSKPKAVFICGNHECINKKEANEYFKENLTLSVKILDQNKKELIYDLVKLNIDKEKDFSDKSIKVKKSQKNKLTIKKLSKDEIKKRKQEMRFKEKNIKKKTKNIVKKNNKPKKKLIIKKDNINNIITNNVCQKLKDCNIDEIADLLIKNNKNKKFPNLSKSNL